MQSSSIVRLLLFLWLAAASVRPGLAAPDASPAPPASRLPDGGRIADLLSRFQWAAAESLAEVDLKQVTTAAPVDSLAMAEAFNAIVRARLVGGTFREGGTKSLADSTVALRIRGLGPDHPAVAEGLATLARLMGALGDLAGSKPVYERSLAIREKAFGPEHRLVAQSLNSLGVINGQMGDHAAARACLERALAIRLKLLGPDHPEVGDTSTNLAYFLGESGDYLGARTADERALAIYEKAFGPDHARLCPALNNLGSHCRLLGEYDTALAMFERAAAIAEKTMGPDAPDVGQFLANVASIHTLTGNHAKARELYGRALAIREKAYGPYHREVGTTLANLAELERLAGDCAASLEHARRSADIFDRLTGPEAPDATTALLVVANSERDLRRFDRADSLYRRIAGTRQRLFGSDNLRVGEVLRNQSVARLAAGDQAAAITLALRAESIGREQFRLVARGLPENEAIRYAAADLRGLDVALTAATAAGDTSRGAELWAAEIAARGQVLDEMASRRHDAWRIESPEITARRNELVDAERVLAHWLVQGSGAEFAERLRAARDRREAADRALAEASLDYRAERSRQAIDLAAVRQALPPGSALVAYVRYRAADDRGAGGAANYAAFALGTPEAPVQFVPLGDSASVEPLVAAWRAEAARGPRAGADPDGPCRQAGEALRRRVWDPVARFVTGARRIFVVPDGVLHLVNLGALPAPGTADGYLVDLDPLLHAVTTERDLVPPENDERSGSGFLALGGAAFDAGGSPEEHGSGAPPDGPGVFRGLRSNCPRFREVRFAPLPGTLREVRDVAQLWESAGRAAGDLHLLTGGAATEAAVKRLAPGRRLLHLATHGFFIAGDCTDAADQPDVSRGIGGLVPSSAGRKTVPSGSKVAPVAGRDPTAARPAPASDHGPVNPLRLAGIALAGANHRNGADPAGEDGVLTAEEVAALDLQGVEWAVLSACDTGLGEISAGEGIFGLHRALVVAGARSVILSLWAVRDQDARPWMEALYRSRLLDGRDTATCVRDACRARLAELRKERRSTHPFYWGGFLATGDWR